MANEFKRAAVIINSDRDRDRRYSNAVISILKSHGCKTATLDMECPPFVRDADVYVVIGGDGTMLRAAREAAEYGIPIIGVNVGHLGYMTEIETDELELLNRLFEGEYTIDERMMLEVRVLRGKDTIDGPCYALNDAVISKGSILRVVDIELLCGGRRVGHYRADGLICATPTGSTAYSLSAGGPVVDPSLECICVTVVSPHSLRVRPMLFSPDVTLEIQCGQSNGGESYLTVDGDRSFRVEEEDTIRVTRSMKTTKLIRLKKYGFFDILANKMSE